LSLATVRIFPEPRRSLPIHALLSFQPRNSDLSALTCPPFVLRFSRQHIHNPSFSLRFCYGAAGPLSFRSLTIDPHPIVRLSSPLLSSKENDSCPLFAFLPALCIQICEANSFLFSSQFHFLSFFFTLAKIVFYLHIHLKSTGGRGCRR